MSAKAGRRPMLACKDDLRGSLAHAWFMLQEGVTDRRSPFHVCTLATVDADGNPQARSVVLRECHAEERWIRFNTDMRTEKARNIATNPVASMLFYDAQEKVQLRLGVRLALLPPEERARVWDQTPHYSRECYQVTRSPGQPIASPHDVVFDADITEEGEPHFAPVRAQIDTIEWLYLAVRGHRRARFQFVGEEVTAQWLVP